MKREAVDLPPVVAEKLERGEIDPVRAEAFLEHLQSLDDEVYAHELIQRNPYTEWFGRGEADTAEVRELISQFSVFSNHFIPLEAKRMVNAATEADEAKARSILGNEIGVPIDIRTGDIEGFRFSHAAAHIKWLRDIGEMLGLDRNRLGKWDLGSPATRRFLDDLERVYGNPNHSTGSGASFAIESWAGFGIGKGEAAESRNFWKQLVTGLDGYNRRHRELRGLPRLDTSFFQHHFDLEVAHVVNVETELSDSFFAPDFDSVKWLDGARRALDAMLVFWKGLDAHRSGSSA